MHLCNIILQGHAGSLAMFSLTVKQVIFSFQKVRPVCMEYELTTSMKGRGLNLALLLSSSVYLHKINFDLITMDDFAYNVYNLPVCTRTSNQYFIVISCNLIEFSLFN